MYVSFKIRFTLYLFFNWIFIIFSYSFNFLLFPKKYYYHQSHTILYWYIYRPMHYLYLKSPYVPQYPFFLILFLKNSEFLLHFRIFYKKYFLYNYIYYVINIFNQANLVSFFIWAFNRGVFAFLCKFIQNVTVPFFC